LINLFLKFWKNSQNTLIIHFLFYEILIQQLDRYGEGELAANSTQNKENLYKNIKVVLADEFAEIERAFN